MPPPRGAGALRVRTTEDERLVIEEIPATNYCCERQPGNEREVLSQAIAWTVPSRRDKPNFLRVEHHEPGR